MEMLYTVQYMYSIGIVTGNTVQYASTRGVCVLTVLPLGILVKSAMGKSVVC